jgi:hypothetical protein
MNINETEETLKCYFSSLEKLKELKIITNAKDFTGQIGEWVATIIYNGRRAESGINPDWDVVSEDGKYYQIKTSAKSATSKTNPTSDCDYSDSAKIDYFIIIIFSESYELKSLYEIPWEVVKSKRVIHSQKHVIKWSDVKDYKKDLIELKKKHTELSIFIK